MVSIRIRVSFFVQGIFLQKKLRWAFIIGGVVKISSIYHLAFKKSVNLFVFENEYRQQQPGFAGFRKQRIKIMQAFVLSSSCPVAMGLIQAKKVGYNRFLSSQGIKDSTHEL